MCLNLRRDKSEIVSVSYPNNLSYEMICSELSYRKIEMSPQEYEILMKRKHELEYERFIKAYIKGEI